MAIFVVKLEIKKFPTIDDESSMCLFIYFAWELPFCLIAARFSFRLAIMTISQSQFIDSFCQNQASVPSS